MKVGRASRTVSFSRAGGMIAVAGLLALTAVPATAGLLTPQQAASLTSFSYSGYSVFNEYNVTISGSPGQNGYFGSGQIDLIGAGANAGEILAAWCVDVFHDLQGSDNYQIVPPPFTNNGDNNGSQISSKQLGEIGALVHWGDANINLNSYISAAVQLAIWSVEYPGATFTSDNMLVNNWVTTLLDETFTPSYAVREVVHPGINQQGLVFEVATPLPSTWTMMLTGLGAMGLFGFAGLRKRRKTGRNLA